MLQRNRRDFLAGCSLLPFGVGVCARGAAGATINATPWFQRCLVGMEVGPTGAHFGYSDPNDTRYAARFDGAEIVRRCVAAHGEYLVLWVRDGDYAYYNSKILPKALGLGDRDPLQEAVDEAAKHSLPIIAYCVVQQAGHFLQQHPEWEMRGADGIPLGRYSFRSGYLQAMKEILTEQIAYGIAGFHIDMLDQGFGPPYGCWSDDSRKAFEREFGHPMPEMPNGPTWDAAWDQILEFRYRSSEIFERELTDHVRSVNPQATVDFNYHGNPPFSWEVGQRPVQHAGNGDFVTGETGVWGFSALGVGLNAEFYRASTPGLPYQVAIQRGVRNYHDQTTRPVDDMRWELFTLLSHGAFVTMVDKTAFDGSLDPVAYQRFERIFSEARLKREHFGHAPIYDAGLYYSSRSRDWMGKETAGKWMQSFIGAHKSLRYEQLGCGVVLDENATLQTLMRYPVIILCNAGILSDHEIELLQEYVTNGGNVIVTGHSGQFDHLGQPKQSLEFEQLIGGRVVSRLESLDNWCQFYADDLAVFPDLISIPIQGAPEGWSFLMKGPATQYSATTASGVGKFLRPARTTRQLSGNEGTQWPMSPEAPVGPALLVHRSGNGTVITFAGSPDFATGSEHHITEARRMLSQAVRYLNPSSPVHIEAPPNIQTVVTREENGGTYRIHFLGYNAPPQSTPASGRPLVIPAMIEQPPLFRATIRLRDSYRAVRALNPNTVIHDLSDRIEVTIHDIHEVLLISV